LNNLVTREDWITLAKYYVSNHKPYQVKKYVPYRPSNSTITTRKPRLPVISSSTQVPDVTKSPLETSTMGNLDAFGLDSTTTSDQATETSTVDFTKVSIMSTTELPSTLLSILSGIETSTTTSYDDAIDETFKQDNLSNNTIEISLPYTTTETTAVFSSTDSDVIASIDVTTEAPISTSPENLKIPESTTQNFFSSKFSLDETTESSDSTTQVPMITTEPPLSTTENSSFENDTTTIQPTTPESTTERMESTTQDIEQSTTSSELETTTKGNDSTIHLNITKVNFNTEKDSIENVSTFTAQGFNFNDDIIRNKLVNITYSTDVMPEIYY
ncbi:hypothetical protein KR093_007466, partial [Drosophila rubida]